MWEAGDDSSSDDETGRAREIADDQRPATTNAIDKQNSADLAGDTPNVRYALIQECLGSANADLFVDVGGEILDCGHARELTSRLKSLFWN